MNKLANKCIKSDLAKSLPNRSCSTRQKKELKMDNAKSKKAGVDRSHGKSVAEKTVFMLGHFIIVLVCAWIVFFEGVSKIGILFEKNWYLSDINRGYVLLSCAFLYWVRHAITLFFLIVRKVEWSEVIGLLFFIAIFEIGLVVVGGGAFRDYSIGLGWFDLLALFFLLFGSYLNSFSEIQRKWWKEDLSNKGRCYTEGLFKYSMHINYFGDTVLFIGWCLFTYNFWTLGLPILMAGMFIFIHIPGLDSYLSERYGNEFKAYAEMTKKFVPFIY